MSRYLPFIIAFAVFAVAAWFVLDETMNRQRCVQKIEVPEEYLNTLDSSRYSVQSLLLERTYRDDSLLMIFPEANRKSEIYLYDRRNYYRLLLGYNDVVAIPQENKEILKALLNRPVVNLSGLEPGKYYVHATSCNFGGYFEVEISDEKALDSN
jgi:hypothetical protein